MLILFQAGTLPKSTSDLVTLNLYILGESKNSFGPFHEMLWRNPNELLASPVISFLVDMLEMSLLLLRLASVSSPEKSLFSHARDQLPLQAFLMVETGLGFRLSGGKLARVSPLDCWIEGNCSWQQWSISWPYGPEFPRVTFAVVTEAV